MKSVLACLSILFLSFVLYSDREITGIVLDESGPIAFANVILKGTTIGTTTDIDGNFKLTIPETEEDIVLVFSFVGYTKQEFKVKKFDKPIRVVLTDDRVSLDETIVTAKESSSMGRDSRPGLLNTISKSKKSKPSRKSAPKAPVSAPKAVKPPRTTSTESIGYGSSMDMISTKPVKSSSTTTGVTVIAEPELYVMEAPKKEKKKNVEEIVSPDIKIADARTDDGDIMDSAPPTDPPIQPVMEEIEESHAKTLTAGEINDFSKWDMWNDLNADELSGYSKKWQIQPQNRYCVKVKTSNGAPAINKKVDLLANDGSVLWTTYTDNAGRAELWQSLLTDQAEAKKLVVHYKGGKKPLSKIKAFKSGINTIELPVECENIDPIIDIAFVVDATGSMADEISYLKAELKDVINQVKVELPKSTVRTGSVFYRDHGDEYVTRHSDFSTEISTTVDFIAQQYARGGGDYPEAVDDALQVALNDLNWDESSTSKLLFLILDAPPHSSPESLAKMKQVTKQAAEQGIRVIPITCSGIQKGTEYLMRSLALATNGTYTFLTDDSGVGGAHLEPSTDLYNVELLNYLMIRLITQFSETKECEEDYTQTIIDINEQNNQSNLIWEYYPNPTQGMFTVKAEKPMEEILIADMNGKLLIRKTPNAMTKEFNISDFPSGVYLIRVHFDENTWETGRIVLVHER